MNINLRTIISSKNKTTLVAQNNMYLNYCILPSLYEHKREMIKQKPLSKSQLTKQTLVAHASKLITKINGSNPNWRLQYIYIHNNTTHKKRYVYSDYSQ